MCGITTALGIVGTAVSAAGSVMAGQQQQAMANAQAAAYDQQARADAQASAYEASRERHKQELAQAAARAQVGASGVALAGSPTEVLAANAREGALDIASIRYGSQLRQGNLQTQAAISRFSGRQARTAGYINAVNTGISGISNLYDPNRAVRFGSSPFQ